MKRDYSISIMRVFAMLMIVYYHCLCYNLGAWVWFENSHSVYPPLESAFVRNIAYVGLDAFVFISGLLYCRIGSTGKYNNIKCFIIGKGERLLIPYAVWGLLQFFILYTFEKPSNLFYGSEHLWFLLMLFEVFTLAALTKGIWRKISIKTCIMFFISLLFLDWAVNKFNLLPRDEYGRTLFCFQSTLKYLPMFYLGMMTELFQVYKKFKVYWKLVPPLAILLFSVGALLNFVHLPLSQAYTWVPTSLLLILCYGNLRDRKRDETCLGGVKQKFYFYY